MTNIQSTLATGEALGESSVKVLAEISELQNLNATADHLN
jgi:hypothetical protein